MSSSKLLFSGIVVLILAGLGTWWPAIQNNNQTSPQLNTQNKISAPQAQVVNASEFSTLAENKDTFVIDVHVPEQSHLPNTDAVIPYNQIQQNVSKLPADKTTPILVYCRSGSMSTTASQEIASLGYTNVYDLAGGTDAYKEQQESVKLWPNEQALGEVVYGTVAKTTFTLTNYTPSKINITRVSTSCGCTKATVEKEVLEPYENTTVQVSFDPAVHKNDTDVGELTRTIYIETDHPNFSVLESSITANVVKE